MPGNSGFDQDQHTIRSVYAMPNVLEPMGRTSKRLDADLIDASGGLLEAGDAA